MSRRFRRLSILNVWYRFGYSLYRHSYRVATDLENPEKSRNVKGDFWKVREFATEFRKSGKVKDFCCLKFIFSQVEDPNFENFSRAT